MLEGLTHFIREVFCWVREFFGPGLVGKVGSWTSRFVTFGKWEPDEESWTAIVIGSCVVVFGSFCGVMCWRLYT